MGANRSASVARTVPEELLSRLQTFDWLAVLRGFWARTHVRWLGGIVLLALALRLVVIVTVQPDPTAPARFDDTVFYDASAQALADGRGYAIPRRVVDEPIDVLREAPTARWPPGYPLVLAGIYFFFGHTLLLARLLNVVVGTATVVLVYLVGCKLSDRRVGLLGAFLFALYPTHILFSTLLMTEVLFTFLFVGVLLLGLAWGERGLPKWWQLVVLGALTGLVGMVRGEAILLPLAIAFGWALIWRSLRQAALSAVVMMAGLMLVFIPWTVRNTIQLDAPIFATTGAGGALIQAHRPGADGAADLDIESRYEGKYSHVPYPEREVKLYNRYVRDALTYMKEHPGRELELVFLRFHLIFRNDDSGVVWLQLRPPSLSEGTARLLSGLSQAYYLTVMLLALVSAPLWLSLRRPARLLLVVAVAYYIGLHVLFFIGEARYHVPLMPMFVLWAAMGLLFAWDRRPRAPGRVAMG